MARTTVARRALVDEHLGTIRTEFGRFGRQVSGYSLEHLLPEKAGGSTGFLVGTEGTLGVVLDATVRLVEDAPARALAVLGYPTMADAADAVPALLRARPGRVRGPRPADRRHGGRGHPELPAGGGWLFAEVTGATAAEAESQAQAVADDCGRRAPGRHRRRRAARAVADPRGRRRPGRALA